MCLRKLRKSKLKIAKGYKLVTSDNKAIFFPENSHQYKVGKTYLDNQQHTIHTGFTRDYGTSHKPYPTGYHIYDARTINYSILKGITKEMSDWFKDSIKVLLVELSDIVAFGDSDLSFTICIYLRQARKLRTFVGREMKILADVTKDVLEHKNCYDNRTVIRRRSTQETS